MNNEEIINDITEIRAKNNKNWMQILKLAFKYAPEEAKQIMKNITECDSVINKLTQSLGEDKEENDYKEECPLCYRPLKTVSDGGVQSTNRVFCDY